MIDSGESSHFLHGHPVANGSCNCKDSQRVRFNYGRFNVIEELVESTIVKFFGEGQAVVNTENLRPQRFGDNRGVLFDLSAIVTESPEYKGLVGAFIANEKLYVVYFLDATPYYYGKHIAEAEAIIKSATI